MKNFVEISGHMIGDGCTCFVIAECGLYHEGSLGQAFRFVDAAKEAGANAVKFQTHIAEAEGTKREVFRIPVFPQDETRQDYWKRTAFTEDEWLKLKKYCDEKDIVFLSSPFSEEAVDLLLKLDVPAFKLGSGEINNYPLIEKIASTGKPVLLSSGMSSWDEIKSAVSIINRYETDFILFQCTSSYPTQPEELGLNVICEMRNKFDCPIGFSDHSGTTVAPIAAFMSGACVVEVHVAFSKDTFGPDVKASILFTELRSLVDSLKYLQIALSNPVNKDDEATKLEPLRKMFTKSIVAKKKIKKGALLSKELFLLKKPGDGLSADFFKKIAGRKILRDLDKNEQLRQEDYE